MVNNYNDYMLDLIIENSKNDKSVLVFSVKLLNLFENINHPIARKLIELYHDYTQRQDNFEITLLDINDKNDQNGKPIFDSILFMNSNKAMELSAKDLGIVLTRDTILTDEERKKIYRNLSEISFEKTPIRGRSETSLGRIVRKLFNGEFKESGDKGNDIESFVNMYKSLRDTSKFELVKGYDVIHWYNRSNYKKTNGGTLGNSCMGHDRCSQYLEFYAENQHKVSLLILKDENDDTKIKGRALIWDLDYPEKKFMDRIYYDDDFLIDKFKEYAKQNGWLYKKNQTSQEYEPIIDSSNNNTYDEILVSDIVDTGFGHYPYMDTLKYFNGSELSNGISLLDGKTELLEDQYGGTSKKSGRENNDDLEFIAYYDNWLDRDELVYCELGDDFRLVGDFYHSEYYDCYVATDYAETQMKECDYGTGPTDYFREKDDYVELGNGKIATKEYAKSHNL